MGTSKSWRRKGCKRMNKMVTINPDAAGIDIGSEEHWVAIGEDKVNPEESPVRKFGAFTCDVEALGDWLARKRIKTVAMESTGVYWIPVYELLERRGFTVLLVNARDIKNVPGRKTDIKDCQWIQQLHSFGLLRGSFRPADKIIQIRALVRQRDTLVKNNIQHVQRMQKALTQMNIMLHKVISDITGVTGLKIIDQILAGERCPEKLATLCDARIKRNKDAIIKSLQGNWRNEHLFSLKQELEGYRFFTKQIQVCEAEINRTLDKFDDNTPPINPDCTDTPISNKGKKSSVIFKMHAQFKRITGVDLSWVPGFNDVTMMILFSEIGIDMNAWPSEKHFTSWLGLSPSHKISGGKILARKTRNVVNRAANALRLAAQSVQKTSTALGAFCRRLKSRLGPAKAITATARKLACIYYRSLKTGVAYVEIGANYYEQRYRDKLISNLKKKAKMLGLQVIENIDNHIVPLEGTI